MTTIDYSQFLSVKNFFGEADQSLHDYKVLSNYGIVLDTDIYLNGKDLYFIAPIIIVQKPCQINLSGIDQSHIPEKANYNERPKEGSLGMNGGNLYFYGKLMNPQNIHFISNGGNGGQGQDVINPPDCSIEQPYPTFKLFDECRRISKQAVKGAVFDLLRGRRDYNNQRPLYYLNFELNDLWKSIFLEKVYQSRNLENLTHFNSNNGKILYITNPQEIESEFEGYHLSTEHNALLVEEKLGSDSITYGHVTIDKTHPSILHFFMDQHNPLNKDSSSSDLEEYSVSVNFNHRSSFEGKIHSIGIIENTGRDGIDAYEGGKGGEGGLPGNVICIDESTTNVYIKSTANGEKGPNGNGGRPTGSIPTKRLYLVYIQKSHATGRNRLIIFYAYKNHSNGTILHQKNSRLPSQSFINKEYILDAIFNEIKHINLWKYHGNTPLFIKFIQSNIFTTSYTFQDGCDLCGKLFIIFNDENISPYITSDFLLTILERLPIILNITEPLTNPCFKEFERLILMFLYKRRVRYRSPVLVTDYKGYLKHFGISTESTLNDIKNEKIVLKFEETKRKEKEDEIRSCVNAIEQMRKTILSSFDRCKTLLKEVLEQSKYDIEHYLNVQKANEERLIEMAKRNCAIEGIFGVLSISIIGFSLLSTASAPIISGVGCASVNILKNRIMNKSIEKDDLDSIFKLKPSYKIESDMFIVGINKNCMSDRDSVKFYEDDEDNELGVPKETSEDIRRNLLQIKMISQALAGINQNVVDIKNRKKICEQLTEVKHQYENNIIDMIKDSENMFSYIRQFFNEVRNDDGSTLFKPKKDFASLNIECFHLKNYFNELKEKLNFQLSRLNELRANCKLSSLGSVEILLKSIIEQANTAMKTSLKLEEEIIHMIEGHKLQNLILNLQSIDTNELGEYRSCLNDLKLSLFESEREMIISNLKRSLAAYTFPFVIDLDIDTNSSLKSLLELILNNQTTISSRNNLVSKINNCPFCYFRYEDDPKRWDDFLDGKKIAFDVRPFWKEINAIKLIGEITFTIYIDTDQPLKIRPVGFKICKQGPDNYYLWDERVYSIPFGIPISGLMSKCVVKPISRINEIYDNILSFSLKPPVTVEGSDFNQYDCASTQERYFFYNNSQFVESACSKVLEAKIASPYSMWVLQLSKPIHIEEILKKNMILQMEGPCSFVYNDGSLSDMHTYYSKFEDHS